MRHAFALSWFFMILVLDQISKWYVFEMMLRVNGERRGFLEWLGADMSIYTLNGNMPLFQMIDVTSFFNLVAVWNTGVSFGMLQDSHSLMPMILTVFASLVGIAILIWGLRSRQPLERGAAILIAAGAIGNAWDRFRFGAVADFFDFYWGNFHWPAFNVADAAIVVGAAMLIIYIFTGKTDKV